MSLRFTFLYLQKAVIYMTTRLVVNVSQVYLPVCNGSCDTHVFKTGCDCLSGLPSYVCR